METTIRVLHIFGSLNKGGAESRTMDIYRHIDRDRIQFHFAVHTDQVEAYEPEIEAMGGQIYHGFPSYIVSNHCAYQAAWYRFFQTHPYKILHIHTTNTAVPILMAAWKAGIPVRICHARSASENTFSRRLFIRLNRPLLRKYATALLAVSDLSGMFAFKKGYQVVSNAIPIRHYRYSYDIRQKVRIQLHLENAFVMGHIGRFHPVKNHLFLLQCFAALLSHVPNAQLLLIGDGEQRSQIEEFSLSLGIVDHVHMPGICSNIPELLQAFDVFVLPSFFEGMPGVAIEAQAAGVPCLLSDTITKEAALIRDLVEFLPISNGVAPWVDAMLRVTKAPQEHRDTYDELQKAGFDVELSAQWYRTFYEDCIKQCDTHAGKGRS